MTHSCLTMIGYRVAQGDRYPEWKAGSEFKAKRDEMMRALPQVVNDAVNRACYVVMFTPKAFANSSPAITPKAFANFSPGLERSDNPGIRPLK